MSEATASTRAAEAGESGRSAVGNRWVALLHAWYHEHGRHELAWRATRERWPVLVSEVMLQQTQVPRVLPRWHAFLERWPQPVSLAAEPLDELLRFWQGLGYPRRALALHRIAVQVTRQGWPADEAGLRTLPGVGAYTARALRCFCDGAGPPLPMDVNVRRVIARAVHGDESATPSAVQSALDATLPRRMRAAEHVFALFDLGATVCTARAPACDRCPLQRCCAWRARGTPPPAASRRPQPWSTSLRRLRGAVLAAMLEQPAPADWDALCARVAHVPAAAEPALLDAALRGLCADGLLTSEPWMTG